MSSDCGMLSGIDATHHLARPNMSSIPGLETLTSPSVAARWERGQLRERVRLNETRETHPACRSCKRRQSVRLIKQDARTSAPVQNQLVVVVGLDRSTPWKSVGEQGRATTTERVLARLRLPLPSTKYNPTVRTLAQCPLPAQSVCEMELARQLFEMDSEHERREAAEQARQLTRARTRRCRLVVVGRNRHSSIRTSYALVRICGGSLRWCCGGGRGERSRQRRRPIEARRSERKQRRTGKRTSCSCRNQLESYIQERQ